MATDTTDPSYWLNITFFLCAAGVLALIVIASILIWKFEVLNRNQRRNREGRREEQVSTVKSSLSADGPWKTCLKKIRPAWLMTYRFFAFSVLLSLLVTNAVLDGGNIFFFYTQWTFTLVTCYFGLGSTLSIYGCCVYKGAVSGDSSARVNIDAEQGTYVAPSLECSSHISNSPKVTDADENSSDLSKAGFLVYVFQIMYQICAGAVLLTDSVFWLILYPFLMSADYKLNLLDVCLHSLNAVFLLGDSFLNGLRFPFFRIAYFLLWTSIYVIFQWIIHACISLWWPYPFLDLSVKSAPFWYFGVAAMHIPCYGIFALVIRFKHFWLSRSFPESYQC